MKTNAWHEWDKRFDGYGWHILFLSTMCYGLCVIVCIKQCASLKACLIAKPISVRWIIFFFFEKAYKLLWYSERMRTARFPLNLYSILFAAYWWQTGWPWDLKWFPKFILWMVRIRVNGILIGYWMIILSHFQVFLAMEWLSMVNTDSNWNSWHHTISKMKFNSIFPKSFFARLTAECYGTDRKVFHP